LHRGKSSPENQVKTVGLLETFQAVSVLLRKPWFRALNHFPSLLKTVANMSNFNPQIPIFRPWTNLEPLRHPIPRKSAKLFFYKTNSTTPRYNRDGTSTPAGALRSGSKQWKTINREPRDPSTPAASPQDALRRGRPRRARSCGEDVSRGAFAVKSFNYGLRQRAGVI